jgi:DNA-binding transcriptional ArsR family regulator
MPYRNEDLYERKAKILKVIAHPMRLKIIDFLSDGESCVCNLVKLAGRKCREVKKNSVKGQCACSAIMEATPKQRREVYAHLKVMTKKGILSTKKVKKWLYYKLELPCIEKFIAC